MTVTVCSVSEKAYAMSSTIAHKAEPLQNAEIIHTIRPAFHVLTTIALYIATPTTRVAHSALS